MLITDTLILVYVYTDICSVTLLEIEAWKFTIYAYFWHKIIKKGTFFVIILRINWNTTNHLSNFFCLSISKGTSNIWINCENTDFGDFKVKTGVENAIFVLSSCCAMNDGCRSICISDLRGDLYAFWVHPDVHCSPSFNFQRFWYLQN